MTASCFASEPFSAPATSAAPALTVPKFECNLPAFRSSGDATNEVRQLRKLEKRHRSCVKNYKSELRQQRKNIIAIQKNATTPVELKDIQAALLLIDHILASDFKPKQKGPGPDRRDFVDPHHGG
tara:strand:+ start:38686 stop:39060 length:375 start_codon:yes stop_codon:yes gene_type:complete